MTKPLTILTTVLACLVLCSAAFVQSAAAQSAGPITDREVVGDWTLLITPTQENGRTVTFKARDGSQRLNFPLAITTRPNGRLSCTVGGDPAECRIRNGELSVVQPADGFRMIFTLRGRTRGGFTGVADLRVRLLPVGGPVGSVTMTRR